jgi:hypothetical protein
MKTTLFCVHVFPHEIEMFERLMHRLQLATQYLDETDTVTLFCSLNLNPTLVDWNASRLTPEYFIERFTAATNQVSLPNINTIHTDTSLLGTTHHKRLSITKEFDQFIFCDPDILFPDTLLKNQLNASYLIDAERYVISPAIPRWWDDTWDTLCDTRFKDADIGSAQYPSVIDSTITQSTDEVQVRDVYPLKFGCGMHTLYGKKFWDMVGIPEIFGGYGPEDTFAMTVGNIVYSKYPTAQYVLDGIYITEDYNRTPSFGDAVIMQNNKDDARQKATTHFTDAVRLRLSFLGIYL